MERKNNRLVTHWCDKADTTNNEEYLNTRFTSHYFQRHYQNYEGASTPQSGKSHKTSFGGFGGNGSIAWTSAISHVGRTSNAFKVTMKLQTFLFQMVVTSCISVQYLWKYGFAKSSDNLYAPCIINQKDATLAVLCLLKTTSMLYMFRTPFASIFRSTINCNSSHWCLSRVGLE